VYEGYPTGDLIDIVLDEAGWSASKRSLDTGSTIVPIWWAKDKSPWQAILELVAAEGPGAFLFESGAGSIVFHDRQHRVTSTRSNTSQATFRDTGSEPTYQIPMGYRRPWEAVVNEVSITPMQSVFGPVETFEAEWSYPLVTPFDKTLFFDTPIRVVGLELPSDPGVPYISAYKLHGSESDEEDGWWVVDPSDFDDSFGDITSPTTANYLTINFNGDGFIGARVRLRNLATESQDPVTDDDATSIAAYERAGLTDPPDWLDTLNAEAVAATIIHNHKDPQPRITIRVSNGNSTRYTAALTLEVNDLVTVIDANASMNRNFWVERITDEVSSAGLVHHRVIEASAYVAPPVAANAVFRFNDATLGRFNTGGGFGL
jgi:hypothetical protein